MELCLWAVILKQTGEMIGQCGLTMQPWKESEVLEIGYLFERLYWHNGYAVEAAAACKKYAFEVLIAEEVCSIIRDTNTASQNVAIRNGIAMVDTWTKHYKGVDMPHFRYVAYHWPIPVWYSNKRKWWHITCAYSTIGEQMVQRNSRRASRSFDKQLAIPYCKHSIKQVEALLSCYAPNWAALSEGG